jgi:hypothetical protein
MPIVCGERSAAVACASRSKRFWAAPSEASSPWTAAGRISFTAAGRASIRWVARQTSPMPPLPSRSTRR